MNQNRIASDEEDAALREQVSYVSTAQGEPMVQPDSVTDDFRWKAMPFDKVIPSVNGG